MVSFPSRARLPQACCVAPGGGGGGGVGRVGGIERQCRPCDRRMTARYNQSKRDGGNRDLYLADYVKLYVDTVRLAVSGADPERRAFVDSSPSNGLVSTDPYVKRWGDVQARVAHRVSATSPPRPPSCSRRALGWRDTAATI